MCEWKKCNHCGQEIREWAIYCPNCDRVDVHDDDLEAEKLCCNTKGVNV